MLQPLEDGKVYQLAFDGNDSDAEVLEKATGLTFLGDCIEPFSEPIPCAVTGRMTTKKQTSSKDVLDATFSEGRKS